MSTLVTEYLNGGLVTARDATELKPGEIQQGDECVYRMHDPAIYGRPGRTQYNSTTIKDSQSDATAVKGLAHLSFESTRTSQIIALGGDDNEHGALWFGDFTAITGGATFSRLTGPGQVTDAVTTSASPVVTSASGGFASMVQGARITAAGVPANSIVITVTSANSITISKDATASGTVTATFDMGIAVVPQDGGGEIIQVVQWGGAYYAVFAHGEMLRIYFKGRSITTSSLSDLLVARPAGMQPVTVQPTVTVVSGTWSAVLGNGYYWFLITESYDPDQPDEVEGTYIPLDDKGKKLGPVAAHITDYTAQAVQITHNALANDGSEGAKGRIATHWNVYMSPKQEDNVVTPSFAVFRRVATFPVFQSNGTVLLTQTLKDSLVSRTGYPTTTVANPGRNAWTDASFLLGAPDNRFAKGKSGSGTSGSENNVPMNRLQAYGFSGSDGDYSALTVTGIQLTIRGAADSGGNAGHEASYVLWPVTTGGKSAGPIFGTFGVFQNRHGGQFDTMGVNWSASDFASGGGFEVYLEKAGSGSRQRLRVDSVGVTVFFTGTSVNLNGRPFRVVTYRDSIGFTIDEPARLPPPESSTCDIFQGSIVANDLGNQTSIRWSLPGEPEAWPKPYVLAFNGEKSDIVTCIKKLNHTLVVGLKETIRRVNYLPSETDTTFKEGLAHEPITEDHGIVGPQAAIRFSRPGGGTYLAFVSYSAFMMTDGVTANYLSRDIKVSDYLSPAYIENCIFRNYPKEQWLVLFYTPVGGTQNTKAIIFCYDQPKEDGTLRAIGPITVSARSAASATLNGVPILLTGHYFGGTIWVEDQGSSLTGYTTDGSTQVTAAPSIITRRAYWAGLDRNVRTEKQYLQHSANGVAVSMTDVVMTAGSNSLTRAAGWSGVTKGMRIVHANMAGDSIVTNVSGTTLTASQNAFETVTATVAFDTGTISVTVRAQSIGTTITNVATTYASTLVGGLLSTAQDAHAQAFDMKIEKVRMPDDTLFDLNTAFRLHHFSIEVDNAGKEQSRSGTL